MMLCQFRLYGKLTKPIAQATIQPGHNSRERSSFMMSKKFTASAALLLISSLLTGSLAAQQGTVIVPKGDGDSLKATDEILQVVSKIRQLEIKQPIKRGAK